MSDRQPWRHTASTFIPDKEKNQLHMLFPAWQSFRAMSRMISAPRQAERLWVNRWKFRGRDGATGRAKSPGLLRNIGGIDNLFLLNRAVHDRLVTQRVDCSGDPAGAMKDLHLRVVGEERTGILR